MLKYVFLAMIVAITASFDPATAQAKNGSNGGPIITSQGHPIEFVHKGQEIIFYIGIMMDRRCQQWIHKVLVPV